MSRFWPTSLMLLDYCQNIPLAEHMARGVGYVPQLPCVAVLVQHLSREQLRRRRQLQRGKK